MTNSKSSTTGALAAVGAFLSWGFLPVYFNVIGPRVSVWEILIHRVVWAAVLLSIVALVTGRWGRVIRLIRRRRAFLALCGSAALIAGNWGLFIWAVTSHHILEASLGYYINPLLNVLLGFLFLGERFRPLQLVSIAVASAGVLIMIVGYGQVPWVALILAGCFGAYGLIRKQVQVESDIGLLIETLLLLPFALIWLGSMYAEGQAAFLTISPGLDLLLMSAGAVTVVPLVLFAYGARRLRLATVGLAQYIAPTVHFLVAVMFYGEVFTTADAITFGCIWAGLALYTLDLWYLQGRVAARSAA